MKRYLPLVACLLLFGTGCGQRPKNNTPSNEPIPSIAPRLQMGTVSSFRTNEPEFFADVDFDGEDERVVTIPDGGPRGMNGYAVYEKGQKSPREDPPFDAINDWTSFNATQKTITQSTYYGFLDEKSALRENLVYTLHRNGRFVLTDSIMVTMRLVGGTFVDSLTTHYRIQGGKMVLVETEAVK